MKRKQDGIVKENEARPLPNGPLGSNVSREVACQVARTYLLAAWLVAGSDLMDGKRGPRTIRPLYKLARPGPGTPMIRALQRQRQLRMSTRQ
ncbi:unnamed protein product [Fusarium graminearum]|nr:unnamed protein product [Fusarium graminearum]CAG1959957.1 unnamed protein product [Fusarium graminearum]CAG1974985.1 unnamed protein product [Fusarium graminearum]VTO84294.1 unnamed protein product [Fusarium graminearum]